MQTSMSRVVDDMRYSTDRSELIAHDYYWDGHNFDRSGRNTFLYRTPNNRYFTVRTTRWQGERDHLEPLDEGTARAMYESLPEHEVEYEAAFPRATVVEA